MTRRAWLLAAGSLALTAKPSREALADEPKRTATDAPPQDLKILDLTVDGDRFLGNRFTLAVPRHLGKDEKVPLLIALHGAGETVDQRTGAYAFVERYGLGTAYDRLRRAPVARTLTKLDYFGDAALTDLNASLKLKPFRGLAIACPYIPNIARTKDDVPKMLDRYAAWIADVVLPRARKEAPVYTDAAHTTIDGVSLGGLVGGEVFLRRPDLFGGWGCVQGAMGAFRIASYADKLAAIARKTPKDIHLETSTNDPFLADTRRLAELLKKANVPNELVVYPGPHDQAWLRESGTLAMLLFHDRRKR